MKDLIRNRARDLGFEACGFSSSDPPASGDQFNSWLESGRHGEMAYLHRNAAKRLDPQKVLPGTRSIVCLALCYSPDNGATARSRINRGSSSDAGTIQRPVEVEPGTRERVPSRGIVARYARYSDYHDIMKEKLHALSEFLASLYPGSRSLWYSDTGPVLERDFAQRAGVGFIGKHTNLIGRSLGNWFWLGEILTTAEIEADRPEKNRCGSCSLCINACPTGAITAPFQLDARKCISYLTIELKGSIPLELRSAIGARIFGCDDCLEVCPWNRFSQKARLMASHARPDLHSLDLIELLRMDEPAFRERFAGTPILRSKRRGLLRNVCVALGNVGGSEAIPALETALQDPEPLIREHAAWALDQIQLRFPRAPESEGS